MIAALLVATALGQSCYSRTYSGYNGYGYGYNSGYKQTYYGYNNGYVDRLLFVPLAPSYTPAVVTTATTTASTPATQSTPAADDRIDRLEASVSKLADAVAALANRPAMPATPTQPTTPSTPTPDDGPIMAGPRHRSAPASPPPAPPPTPAAPPAAPYDVSLRPDTAAALATNCARCHTGATARGNLRIFAAPGTFAGLDLESLAAIADATEAGRMPKHAPISEADRASIVGGVREILTAAGANQ